MNWPGSGELLDTVIPGIGYIDRAVRPNSHAPGFIESGWRRGRIRVTGIVSAGVAPMIDQSPARVEVKDAVIARVGNIDASIRCNSQRAWRVHRLR